MIDGILLLDGKLSGFVVSDIMFTFYLRWLFYPKYDVIYPICNFS